MSALAETKHSRMRCRNAVEARSHKAPDLIGHLGIVRCRFEFRRPDDGTGAVRRCPQPATQHSSREPELSPT